MQFHAKLSEQLRRTSQEQKPLLYAVSIQQCLSLDDNSAVPGQASSCCHHNETMWPLTLVCPAVSVSKYFSSLSFVFVMNIVIFDLDWQYLEYKTQNQVGWTKLLNH